MAIQTAIRMAIQMAIRTGEYKIQSIDRQMAVELLSDPENQRKGSGKVAETLANLKDTDLQAAEI